MLINPPIFISRNHLEGQLPTKHYFNLMAWNISNNPASIETFQSRHLTASSIASLNQLSIHMGESGKSFIRLLKKKKITVVLL